MFTDNNSRPILSLKFLGFLTNTPFRQQKTAMKQARKRVEQDVDTTVEQILDMLPENALVHIESEMHEHEHHSVATLLTILPDIIKKQRVKGIWITDNRHGNPRFPKNQPVCRIQTLI